MTDTAAIKYLTPSGGLPCGNYPRHELVKYVRADIADEMLEALKKIVFDWDGEPEDMADARAAIAKVEGGDK